MIPVVPTPHQVVAAASRSLSNLISAGITAGTVHVAVHAVPADVAAMSWIRMVTWMAWKPAVRVEPQCPR